MKKLLFYSILFCFSIIKCPSFPIPETFVNGEHVYYKCHVNEHSDGSVIVHYYFHPEDDPNRTPCPYSRTYDQNGLLTAEIFRADTLKPIIYGHTPEGVSITDLNHLENRLWQPLASSMTAREIMIKKPAFVDWKNFDERCFKEFWGDSDERCFKEFKENFPEDPQSSNNSSNEQRKDQGSSDDK